MPPQPTAMEFQACVAIGTPRAQSLRQQELVCLQPAHVDCPRYLRGVELGTAGVSGAAQSPAKRPRPSPAQRISAVPKPAWTRS